MKDSEQELDSLFATLETLIDEDPLAPYHQKALELEIMLNEVALDDPDRHELVEEVILELDSTWPYTGEMLQIDGTMIIPIEYSPGSAEDEDGIKEREIFRVAENFSLSGVSRGFITMERMGSDNHVRTGVYHLIEYSNEYQTAGNFYRRMKETIFIRVPVDGTATVSLPDHRMPPNLKTLECYYGDIISDIDQAVYNNEGLTDQLRALSRIRIERSRTFDASAEQTILNYLRSILSFQSPLPCTFSGTEFIYAPALLASTNPDSNDIPPLPTKLSAQITGLVNGLSFIDSCTYDTETDRLHIDPNYRQLAADIFVPFVGTDFSPVTIPLSETISVVKIPAFKAE